MKALLVFVAIAILGGIGYLSMNSQDMAKATPEAPVDQMTDQGTEETADDGDVSMGMPVPGMEVDEMIEHEGMDMPDAVSELPEEESGTSLDPNAHVFTVSGTNFAFDVKEIRVKEGDTVTINFSSADGFHDWVVDEFSAATEKVQPGTPTSVTFVADKAGTYEYYCSVGSHREKGMVGTLIVE